MTIGSHILHFYFIFTINFLEKKTKTKQHRTFLCNNYTTTLTQMAETWKPYGSVKKNVLVAWEWNKLYFPEFAKNYKSATLTLSKAVENIL